MTNKSKKRNNLSAEDKIALTKEHLIKKRPVSEICSEHDISPSLFYTWQQALFDNGAQCLEKKRGPKSKANTESKRMRDLDQQLTATKAKLTNKHEVLSELMSEHIALKKSLGN